MPIGKYERTIWHRKRISEGTKLAMQRSDVKIKIQGENNPQWMGDKVSIVPLHVWIRSHKPKPTLCEMCKNKPPYDVANISQTYKRDVNDFEWLCRRCHMIKDGRLAKFNPRFNPEVKA